jgi:hypothetical protein
VEAFVLHPLSSALKEKVARWHEASKQHVPFVFLLFLLVVLHFLSQKNQTLKKTDVSATEAEQSNITHGKFNSTITWCDQNPYISMLR